MFIKLWGLPRSGTNYTKFLIDMNYDAIASQNHGGWKHGHFQYLTIINMVVVKNIWS